VYEQFAGGLTLLSTGPAAANGPYSVCSLTAVVSYPFIYFSCPIAISTDGMRVLFSTRERLTADDTDDSWDVYESSVAPGEPQRSDYQNAAKFCKALRDFLGAEEFGKRYATFGKCVSAS
jgi:hypothetical protein